MQLRDTLVYTDHTGMDFMLQAMLQRKIASHSSSLYTTGSKDMKTALLLSNKHNSP